MKVINVKKMLKRNRFLFFTRMKLTDKLYHTNYIDYLLNSHSKPKEKIKNEMELIRQYWKCEPLNYIRYRLFEKEISEDELLDYIPQYYFYNYYVPTIYNNATITKAGSKIRMNEYFLQQGIETPKVVATVVKGQILSGNRRIDFSELEKILMNSGSSQFFLKPDTGQGGKGILRLDKADRLYIYSEPLTSYFFNKITRNNDFIIQEGVIQREDLMMINPSSVNTLRVITQNFGGTPRIIAASMRIGRNNSFVDNISSGGIYAGVNPETGSLAKYAVDIRKNKEFEKHPDTGFVFGEFRISEWEKIKNQILVFASRAATFPDVAWDIAIMENQISAIELNLNYGIDIQMIVGGLRRKMNIYPKYTA